MWSVIRKARDQGMTIVLSSHSMEECEALCDKLAIMMNGQIQCFDSIPNLKNKFGDGYRLVVKCKRNELSEISGNRLNSFLRDNFHSVYLEGIY